MKATIRKKLNILHLCLRNHMVLSETEFIAFFKAYEFTKILKSDTHFIFNNFFITLTENYSKGEEYRVPGKLFTRVFSPRHACQTNHPLYHSLFRVLSKTIPSKVDSR